MKQFTTVLLLLSVLALPFTPELYAQVSQRVEVKNGEVFVNGSKQLPSQLPKPLKELAPTSNFALFSTGGAYLKIEGHYFKVESNRLVEVPAQLVDSDGTTFIYSSDNVERPLRVVEAKPNALGPYVIRSSNPNQMMARYVESMNEKAEEIETIRYKIDALHAPETAELALELKVGAENMARMAESFPKVQLEAYLADIQDADNFLYSRLVKEQQMEMETHHLAMKIQSAKTREEQEKYTAQLRESLTQIFQLKQENRQKEIEQLAAKLNDLQKRMKERESLKKEIVENRIKELLNQYRW